MESTRPIRMCIICKTRKNQKLLHRFQIKDAEIIFDVKTGRSSYLCNECVKKDFNVFVKGIQKALRTNIDKNILASKLRERFLDGEY